MTPDPDYEFQTSNFEAVKVAMKQDRSGYILTLSVHPDEVPSEIMRDFVGSRYQVVMVRLGDDGQPLDRNAFRDPVKAAGILCRDKGFTKYLFQTDQIPELKESHATEWLKSECFIFSRAELKDNRLAAARLWEIEEDYEKWKAKN